MPDTICPRLIEVALPIREISAESVRDKSLRHGHISTLHLWWARRPLATARAVVFASLLPDPDHPDCPPAFQNAVGALLRDNVPQVLKGYWRKRAWRQDPDPYRPYADIPDTLRNRLLTFIAKWSPEWLAFEKGAEGSPQPPPAQLLDDRCLVKWETSDPQNEQGREVLSIARELVRVAHDGIPTVLDPFAGGGAIPLEATRLGCQAIANDYNPVAYLILRATCEFPQRFGELAAIEPEGQQVERQASLLTVEAQGRQAPMQNRLAHDVEHWAKWILERARQRIGYLYPPGQGGMPVVGYLWARTAPCSNPACRAAIPLLRTLLVCDKKDKRVALTMTVTGKEVAFGIAKGKAIRQTEGTMLTRGNCRCPVCEQVTPVEELRRAGLEGNLGERMVAVITDSPQGKDYRPVEATDLQAFEEAKRLAETVERPGEYIVPEINAPNAPPDAGAHRSISVDIYGFKTFGSLFNPRQLLAMQTFIACLHDVVMEMEKYKFDTEYRKALLAYLGLWVSRIAQRSSNLGVWHTSRETLEHPFGRQAIPMTWDYPEANPFSETTGGASGGTDWILRVIEHESPPSGIPVVPARVLFGDGAKLFLANGAINTTITDPPYFDAVAYADLSDFFYIWLKRAVGDIFSEVFTTPQTPKIEEVVAHKHRHHGDRQKGKDHFQRKLTECFAEARRVCKLDGIIAVMFAHQSTEAWSALINALFSAGLNVTATYPIDTEMTTALKRNVAALASSITVVCRPRSAAAPASFRDVRREIEQAVADSVHRFWGYGFRGADLIVACYGPAVGVFGRYERVERADGTPVSVPELLELARQSALKAIAGEFTGDSLSRLYFVWASLYGVSQQAWDDARLVVQIGGESEDAAGALHPIEVARRRGLFVVDGATCRLALLEDRFQYLQRARSGEGESELPSPHRRGAGGEVELPSPHRKGAAVPAGRQGGEVLIDQLHRAMQFWKSEQRGDLVRYLRDHDLLEHAPFWKLAQALFEVLPRGEEDWKLISALLGERETLRIEARQQLEAPPLQPRLINE